MILLAAGLSACLNETRAHSIIRENGYIEQHQVQKVAKQWDNVQYAVVDGVKLTMDITAPEGKGPFPCVVIIHGGGWELHTAHIMEGMAHYITNHGYVVFNINYRVLPDVKLEQIVDDSMGSVIWVKEHAADYNGDPKKIAVTGDSAGGHLAAMIVTQAGNPAFTPSYKGNGKTDLSVTCAAPSYGVYDFPAIAKWSPSMAKGYLGETYKQNPARYKLLSPITAIKPGLPPQLVIVGDVDLLYFENKSYVEALQKAGDPVEFWVYHGQPHAFLNTFWGPAGTKGYDRIIKFFDEQMKK
jgi:acetyl esterase/lipase